jgi:hypothetical protein
VEVREGRGEESFFFFWEEGARGFGSGVGEGRGEESFFFFGEEAVRGEETFSR